MDMQTDAIWAMVNVADLKDPDDKEGRTYREINYAKIHNIPIGTLVEIIPFECGGEKYKGIRLHVVDHSRDCDGTPLYVLGIKGENEKFFRTGGFGEDDLKEVQGD